MSDFGSGHDLMAGEFEPHVGLCADSSEPGVCFGFCVSSLCTCPNCALYLSVSQKQINVKKFCFNYSERGAWVAQSVKCPTLGFGSGHDPMVS